MRFPRVKTPQRQVSVKNQYFFLQAKLRPFSNLIMFLRQTVKVYQLWYEKLHRISICNTRVNPLSFEILHKVLTAAYSARLIVKSLTTGRLTNIK